jgi:hypothetical protein
MDKEKVIYAITLTDILEVAEDKVLHFEAEDVAFLQDKIGDYMGSLWYEAVEFALTELAANKELKVAPPQ